MANAALQNGLATLDFSRNILLGLVEEIDDDKMCHQPVAGGNHTAWVLGHIAYADDLFAVEVGGRKSILSDDWKAKHGMGSTPTSDRADYPSKAEFLDKLATCRESLLTWFNSLDESELETPMPEGWTDFAPNRAAFASWIAWHEALHSGQLTMIRKSLGLAPKRG